MNPNPMTVIEARIHKTFIYALDDDDQFASGYLQFLKQSIEQDVVGNYGFYWSSVCILEDGDQNEDMADQLRE